MYVLETDSHWGCIKHMHYIVYIETYVLETDPFRGCIEHIRKEKKNIKSLCAKVRLKKEAVYSM